MKCPHCERGELAQPKKPLTNGEMMYICPVCGRGWTQDKKKRWHSHFATDVEIYSADGQKLLDNSTWHWREHLSIADKSTKERT